MRALVVESRASVACLAVVPPGAGQLARIHRSFKLMHVRKQPRTGHRTVDSDNEAGILLEFPVHEMLSIDLAFGCTDAESSGEIAWPSQAIGLQHELHVTGSGQLSHHGRLVDAAPFEGDRRRSRRVSP